MTTSAGRNAPILISMLAELCADPDPNLSQAAKSVPVIFLDTRNHPRQTLDFLNTLRSRFPAVNLRRFTIDISEQELKDQLKESIYRRPTGDSPLDEFLKLVKVRPLASVFSKLKEEGLKANIWLAGNRRDQSGARAGLQFTQPQTVGLHIVTKCFPLADVGSEMSRAYKLQHSLPEYPLPKDRFPSIGLLLEMKELPPGQENRPEKSNRLVPECGIHHNHGALEHVPIREVTDWNQHLRLPEDIIEFMQHTLISRPSSEYSI